MHYIRFSTLFLFLFAGVALLGGCSSQPNHENDETRQWSAEQLYLAAGEALGKSDYDKAVSLYEKVISRYPFDLYAQQSQIEVAYAHYKDENYELVVMAADRFLRMNPTHPSADYAYYLKGLSHANRNNSTFTNLLGLDTSLRCQASFNDAFNEFKTLLIRFPKSRYAHDARHRMAVIRDNLARQEVNVARFYFDRGAIVAAIKRAEYVIENYSQSSYVEDALLILAESYSRLELTDLYNDIREVIELNYPESLVRLKT